jgi:hypothetical protein
MNVTKMSVSLSGPIAGFVENYRKKRGLKRSQVFEEAIKLLRSQELAAAYGAAAAESDPAWETTASDGLADETW